VKERVESKGWLKATQLTLLGWKDDHPLIKDYKLTGIPFFCIVNKWGKVDYIGHPSKIDL
jgi:NADH:ubiquinone oxidoreductase subunit C